MFVIINVQTHLVIYPNTNQNSGWCNNDFIIAQQTHDKLT